MITTPTDTADFGTAGHFIFRVMNIHRILNDCAIFIDFHLLCNPSNHKIVTILVKFDTNEFVSAVCWTALPDGESNVLIAVNSQGTIKVLELV